jgi:hypothetical protein
MGETTSTWKDPLHSSDSEHPWMKDRNSKGRGGAFRINRGERSFISAPGDPTDGIAPSGMNASSVLSNPFDKHST